jgi:hypothetical protein
MKFGKLVIVGAVLAASMYLTGIARADSVSGAFYYQYLGPYTTLSLGSAPTSAPGIAPTATFTVNGASGSVFNFDLPNPGVAGDVDLYTFLTAGGDAVTGINNTSGPGTDNINNGVMVFTGFTSLVAGTTYEFTHDDGMLLYLTGNGLSNALEINSASPTAADTSSFSVSTTGTYSYEVIYAEVNGGPAVLSADVTSSATPEPSSLLLMGTGLLGLAFALFRKNKPAGLVLHS